MVRPLLVSASILLFGCSAPFSLLIHNGLGNDAEITVRYPDTYREKTTIVDRSVFIRDGRAEDASLWYGQEPKWMQFEWQQGKQTKKVLVPSKDFPPEMYHAFVSKDGVRLAEPDLMDRIHEAYAWPGGWCCTFALLAPLLILAHRKIRGGR